MPVKPGSSRRQFLAQLGSVAALPALARQAPSLTWPDLLIAGGRVVDPARGFNGLADVAIVGERILQVGPAPARANPRHTIDARGCIVCPGLIDVHGHVYDEGIPRCGHRFASCGRGAC